MDIPDDTRAAAGFFIGVLSAISALHRRNAACLHALDRDVEAVKTTMRNLEHERQFVLAYMDALAARCVFDPDPREWIENADASTVMRIAIRVIRTRPESVLPAPADGVE